MSAAPNVSASTVEVAIAIALWLSLMTTVAVMYLNRSAVREMRRMRAVPLMKNIDVVSSDWPKRTTIGALALEIGLDPAVEVWGRMHGDADKIVMVVRLPRAASASVSASTPVEVIE